ncbi:hypothetical protein [Antarctobacter jejuensis]|uniref:hypothetical protein n=1 Tax=Antarctobacter jejuensis TaxID=1439938 RepID=UPI003FD266E7
MAELQGEPGDPMWERLWATGRYEHGLLWVIGGLGAGYFLSLLLHGKVVLDPLLAAAAMGLFSFALPMLSFRGWALERPITGTALAAGCMAVGSWAATGKPGVVLVSTGLAVVGTVQGYRVYNNREFRPQMMQAAIERARAEAARLQTKQEG